VGLKSSTEDNVRVGTNVRSAPDSYIGAQPRGQKGSQDQKDSAQLDAYSDASSVGPSPSIKEDDTQSATVYIGIPGIRSSSSNDTRSVAYIVGQREA